MLVLNPKLNIPIVITDTDTGQSWSLFFYYQAKGKPSLAFNAPKNIQITNTARKATLKGNQNATDTD